MSNQKSEFEPTRQTHDVFRIDLVLEFPQSWQIVPVDLDQRCFGVHVISVQHRGVVGEQSFPLGSDCKASRRFFDSRSENLVVNGVLPTEVNKEWAGSLAWSASRWVRPCRRGTRVG